MPRTPRPAIPPHRAIDALDVCPGRRDDAGRLARSRLASLLAMEAGQGYVVYVTRPVAADLPRTAMRLVPAPLPGRSPLERAVNRYLWLAFRRRRDGLPRPCRLA
jgi:hypothetical protein